MIQNIIAQIIVFLAAAYTVFSIVKNLTAKKNSHCGGCSGCSLKDLPGVKHAKALRDGNFQSKNLMLIRNGK